MPAINKIAVVIPVFQTENIIDTLCKKLILSLSEISNAFEIILIDDGSTDNSWKKINENALFDNRIKGFRLSRNFGQHHAISAGLEKCQSEWIVVMDCDMQDNPDEIIKLYQEAIKGYDIVLARRKNRKDSFFKKFNSKVFYWILSLLSGLKFNGEVGNFGIYHKKVIDNINKLKEPFRFFVSSVKWVGFKSSFVDVTHNQRYEGKSSYNFRKLIYLAVNIIISYSNKPLIIMIYTGIFSAIISLAFIAYNLYLYYSGEITQLGYTSIISSIWLLSGVILSSTGILGIYIGKIYDGIKNRPIYIISEKTIND